MFWVGLVIGLVAGGTVGAMVVGVCAAAKRADLEALRWYLDEGWPMGGEET